MEQKQASEVERKMIEWKANGISEEEIRSALETVYGGKV
jgi:hypothetical protein